MTRIAQWTLGLGLLGACAGPPVGAVRDTGSNPAVDAVVDAADVSPGDVVDAAVDAVVDAVVDAGRNDADVAMRADVDVVNARDDADVADAADASDSDRPDVPDVPTADAGPPRMTFTFVGGALNGSASGVTMRATISWQGALRGQSADRSITFEGVLR